MTQYETNHSTAPPWNPSASLVVWIAFGALMLALLVIFRTVLPLLFGTIVIAYLLNPLTTWFEKRVTRGKRGTATALTLLLVLTIAFSALATPLPVLINQTANVAQEGVNFLTQVLTEPQTNPFNGTPIIVDEETDEALSILDAVDLMLEEQNVENIGTLIEQELLVWVETDGAQDLLLSAGGITATIFGSALGFVGSTISLALSSLLSLVILGMLLSSGPSMVASVVRAAPDDYRSDMARLLEDLGAVWRDYVRGNLILGFVVGSAMYVFALIMGLPNALFLAVFAGLMEFVPNVGPVMSWTVLVSLAVGGGSSTFPELSRLWVGLIAAGYGLLVLQLEGLFLVPRILGDSLSLHPVLVIMAVLWGASVGGIIGVVIAPPLVASIRVVLHYIYGRLTNRTAFHARDTDDPRAKRAGFVRWITRRIRELRRSRQPSAS